MMDPGHALLAAGGVFAVLMLLLWPGRGLIARWGSAKQSARRVLIEDALKHLYDGEYKGLPCTLQSVAGVLSVSEDESSDVLSRLESLGLVRMQGGAFSLTEEGRSYALRVIRMHRLWERYLADETGVRETEWHAQAERREHSMTPAEADALSSQMGNPRYDPHGDPIPTSSGDVPQHRGRPLSDLSAGDVGGIIHVEDEPAVVYAQLVALGLHTGMQVRVLAKDSDKVRIEADGNECVLAPIVAANVSVIPLPPMAVREGPYETLALLKPGERARVRGISRRVRGAQRRRLMDLGVLPGTLISMEFLSASGDPAAYCIRGATIALRSQQAGMIYIDREVGENER